MNTYRGLMPDRSIADLPDHRLMDALKHQGAMWFNNYNLLLLEELFRRYSVAKGKVNDSCSTEISRRPKGDGPPQGS